MATPSPSRSTKSSPGRRGASKKDAGQSSVKPGPALLEIDEGPVGRVAVALRSAASRNPELLNQAIRNLANHPPDLAAAFRHACASDARHAALIAQACATSIEDPLHHRELFQEVAAMGVDERRTLIAGYRKAGHGRGVVHAIGQLPRAQGRALMADFVLKPDQHINHDGLRDVLHWLRDAGAEIVRLEKTSTPPPPDTDAAVVEFFEDVADDIVNAVNAVVDAVESAVKSLGQALADVVNWVANDIANLVKALIEAGRTITDLLVAALETGYELVRKIVEGLRAIGQGLFNVMDAAFNLAKDALVTVLRAIDNLGHTLAELLGYLANKAVDIIRRGVEALLAIGKTIGNLLQQAIGFGLTLLRGMVQSLLALGKSIAEILTALLTRPASLFDAVVNSLLSLGRSLSSIFQEVAAAGLDLIKQVAEAAARAGEALIEFTTYLANATADIARQVLDGLLAAGRLFIDVVRTLASHAIEAIGKVVEAFFALGRSLLNLLKETASLALNLLKAVLKAAFDLGKTVLEFTKQLAAFTYRVAARFVEAALAVGIKVVELLESVASATYFAFRKVVNAILQALGPVGDVLGWLLDRGESLASDFWREAVLAIRFVKKSVVDILDWARAQSDSIFELIIQLCEQTGAAITEIIDWAVARGNEVLMILGGIWDRLGNSVIYALNYLETDFIPGIAKFAKGALDAGFSFARLVAWTANKVFTVSLEVVRACLSAGVTLTDLLIETLKHPDQAVQNVLRAARQLGQTVKQVTESFRDAGDEFADEFARCMVAIGEDIKTMLLAVVEVKVGWLDTVIFTLMNLLNGFRSLTAAELADVELVFADSVDFSKVYVATESPANSIIFGIQDFFSGSPSSRAFVTGNLINFDADDGAIERATMVHEMTHVWQNQNVGPIYMAHAVYDQVDLGGSAAYNYGYNDDASSSSLDLPNGRYDGSTVKDRLDGRALGEGGQAVLNSTAAEDFMDFGPEMQGQILMHYFTRRVLLNRPPADYAPWEKFALYVQTHPNVA